MKNISPLRYPGAKTKILYKLEPYLSTNHIEYREPFFGGGSVFFSKGKVGHNWINDKDPNIAILWKVIKSQPEELIKLIECNYPSVTLWKRIKTWTFEENSRVEMAFRTLYLNRTNFSGMLNSNPIGGINQTSDYSIDCRWNKKLLIKKIRLCSDFLQGTRITKRNYSNIITEAGDNVLLFIDPPYYKQGWKLYPTSMTDRQHKYLAKLLRETEHKFILTIDDCCEIREMYSWANFVKNENWKYTMYSKVESCKIGKELFIANFEIPESIKKELTG